MSVCVCVRERERARERKREGERGCLDVCRAELGEEVREGIRAPPAVLIPIYSWLRKTSAGGFVRDLVATRVLRGHVQITYRTRRERETSK